MASRPKKPNKNKKQRRPSGARGAVSQRVATRGYYWAASAIGAALVLAVVIKVRMNATDSAPTVGQLSETDAIGQATEPIDAIVADEELLLELTPELKDLTRSVLNLQLPDLASVDIFADDVNVKDLGHTPPRVVKRFDSVSTRTRSWPVTEPERSLSESRLDLWNPLWKHIAYFEHAKFYFIRGTLSGVDDFDTQVGFAGLARTRAGGFSAATSPLAPPGAAGPGRRAEMADRPVAPHRLPDPRCPTTAIRRGTRPRLATSRRSKSGAGIDPRISDHCAP